MTRKIVSLWYCLFSPEPTIIRSLITFLNICNNSDWIRTELQLSLPPSLVSPSQLLRRLPSGETTLQHNSLMLHKQPAMVTRCHWSKHGWKLNLFQLFKREELPSLLPGNSAVQCLQQRSINKNIQSKVIIGSTFVM